MGLQCFEVPAYNICRNHFLVREKSSSVVLRRMRLLTTQTTDRRRQPTGTSARDSCDSDITMAQTGVITRSIKRPLREISVRDSCDSDITMKNAEDITRSKRKPIAKTKSEKVLSHDIAQNDFDIGEIVWCKLKGHNHWPCKIENFDHGKIVVRWFNDYRYSTVFKSQLFKFSENCEAFSKKKSVALQIAIKEALIMYRNKKIN